MPEIITDHISFIGLNRDFTAREMIGYRANIQLSSIGAISGWLQVADTVDMYQDLWVTRIANTVDYSDVELYLGTTEEDREWVVITSEGETNILALSSGWGYPPGTQSFDITPNGRVVVGYFKADDESPYTPQGFCVNISTDYGATWSGPLDVDYLLSLLGEALYRNQTSENFDYCIEVDESTGIIYALVVVNDGAGDNYRPILIKSTTGLSWELVKDFGVQSWYDSITHLAVSDGKIAVYWSEEDRDTWLPLGQAIRYSDDGGTTWSVSTRLDLISRNTQTFTAPIVINGDTILWYQNAETAAEGIHVYRSTDSGVTWETCLKIVTTNSNDGKYASFRASGGIITVTWEDAYNPDVSGTWEDSFGIHDMNTGGDPYMCLWISFDDGLTWGLENSPYLFVSADTSANSLDVATGTPEIPTIDIEIDVIAKIELLIKYAFIDPFADTVCTVAASACRPEGMLTLIEMATTGLALNAIPEAALVVGATPTATLVCRIIS